MLNLFIFDHVEFPYGMSYDPKRLGLAGKLELSLALTAAANAALEPNCCSHLFHRSLSGNSYLMVKETVPQPGSRKRFAGTTPIFSDTFTISLISQVSSNLLVELALPCSPKAWAQTQVKLSDTEIGVYREGCCDVGKGLYFWGCISDLH